MQCHAESAEGFKKHISIELDSNEVDRYITKVYQDFAFRYWIPEVDTGQATPEQIDAAFGHDAVMGAVAQSIQTGTYPLAMDELDLVGISTPTYQAQTVPEPGQPYRFAVELECSPIPELSSYEPVVVYLPKTNETDPQAQAMLARLRETEAMDALAERVVGPCPEVLCDAEEESILQRVYAQANQADVPFEEFLATQGTNLESFKVGLMHQAERSVRSDLALDAWAAHIKAQVSAERVSEEFARQGLASPALEEAEWRASGRLPQLRQAIRRRMALDDIVATLVVETAE